MAVKRIETRLAGAKWEMNTLPATTGLSCLTQIADILGAPAGAAAGGVKKGMKSVLDLDAGVMGTAVGTMMSKLAEPRTVDLVKTLIGDIRKDDNPIEFDSEFAANYGTLAKLVGWSIKENFASFLEENEGLSDLLSKALGSIQET